MAKEKSMANCWHHKQSQICAILLTRFAVWDNLEILKISKIYIKILKNYIKTSKKKTLP